MKRELILKLGVVTLSVVVGFIAGTASARDLEYSPGSGEIVINVNPGEPTQVEFPGSISGGYKKKDSGLVLDKKDTDLIVFANQAITPTGEAFIVRLEDGRSYSLRAKRAGADSPRDDFVNINDSRGSIVLSKDEEEPAYKEKKFDYAPPTQISGLMREMVLSSEFGKANIAGYKKSDKYKGQVVIDDGAVIATIDTIYIGANLWGYVLDTKNLLNQTQKVNPATFRLDGTRAVSASQWELAPKPYNVEQQIAGRDSTKVYIVTRAK
ncbi:MAG: type-F conjugative transfer system secretin TraK [bacterium]|nr:type-F conjugative transfer system secretin TraK [bacterium]